MKKRYGLESIIGKKSKLRFPRIRVQPEYLSFILLANNAEAEPPLSTALIMKQGDPYDLCDLFNELSDNYNTDLPLRVGITLSGASTIVNVTTPSMFTLINIAFDMTAEAIEYFRASIQEILLASINFALIKYNTNEDYLLSALGGNIKSFYGNISSYNCRRRKTRNTKALIPKNRFKRYLMENELVYHKNLQAYHRKISHFFIKTYKLKTKQRFSLRMDRIEYFYDILDDWEDSYDLFDYDHELDFTDYHMQIILLANMYTIETTDLINNTSLSVKLYNRLSLLQLLSEEDLNGNRTDSNLVQPFTEKLNLNPIRYE